MDWRELLRDVTTVLVIDWPSRDVPETLARAGFEVVVRSGAGPGDYSFYELDSAGAVTRRKGCAPENADLVYAHRPATELPAIIATAEAIHAKAIWTQSGFSSLGSRDASGCWIPDEEYQRFVELVRWAGISYFSQPYIADAVRQVYALKIERVGWPL
jgi:predicted CoA-binding protein